MSIIANLNESGDSLHIYISGQFDFTKHQAFREAYHNLDSKPKNYIIDFKEVDYLDSSSLGSLLLLKDHVGNDSKIRLINCSQNLLHIIKLSRFDMLFDVAN